MLLLETATALRKFLAILLLFIQAYNLVGYRFVFDLLGRQANERMVQRLDKAQYNDADLVEVKVPLLLPYFYSWKDYERFDGEVEFNGVHYNYVKRKVSNDSLILLCIPNIQTAKVEQGQQDYFRLINDVQNNGASKKESPSSIVSKFLLSDYHPRTSDLSLTKLSEISFTFSKIWSESLRSTDFLHYPGQPPESNS
ncbi:MAG: hypothetical protein C5B52_10845 [Bacteroidetes bacterium]|nr:MAG: hypothetical protein C5B52_10845 [Bacteroidota bacterium]